MCCLTYSSSEQEVRWGLWRLSVVGGGGEGTGSSLERLSMRIYVETTHLEKAWLLENFIFFLLF